MNTVIEFCNNLTEIMVDLRFLRGLDENKVYKLKDDLQKLIGEWKDKDYIPKILCDNFMDFSLLVDTCASMYKDNERNKILQFGEEISEMMRICVDVKEGYEYEGLDEEFLGSYTDAHLFPRKDRSI